MGDMLKKKFLKNNIMKKKFTYVRRTNLKRRPKKRIIQEELHSYFETWW